MSSLPPAPKRRAGLILGSDPRRDPRGAEGLRIAAGVAAWKKVSMNVHLEGPAALLLVPSEVEALAGTEAVSSALEILTEAGAEFTVDAAGNEFLQGHGPAVPVREIDGSELEAALNPCDFTWRM